MTESWERLKIRPLKNSKPKYTFSKTPQGDFNVSDIPSIGASFEKLLEIKSFFFLRKEEASQKLSELFSHCCRHARPFHVLTTWKEKKITREIANEKKKKEKEKKATSKRKYFQNPSPFQSPTAKNDNGIYTRL